MSYADQYKSDKGHRLSASDVQFLRDFAAGQHEFVERQTEHTIKRMEAGDATGAIIEGRKATDIPESYRGATRITHIVNGKVVRSTPREPAHIIGDIRRAHAESALCWRGKKDLEVCILSDGTFPQIPEIVPQTIERARLMLYGREATEWALATSQYTDASDFHGAAISGLELAAAHSPENSSARLNDLQISAYTIAATSARHHVAELSNQAARFAEQSSARAHLVEALSSIVGHYATLPKISSVERSQVLSMIYELDDNSCLTDEFIVQAYSLFVRSTLPGSSTRRFFKREVTEAQQRIQAAEQRKRGRSSLSIHMVRMPHTNRPQL